MKHRTGRFSVVIAVAFVLLALHPRPARAADGDQTYYFFVFSNPVAGHEDEYNDWYDHRHAADVVSIPGFVNGQRYVQSDVPFFRPRGVNVTKYLSVYKIVTPDIEGVFTEIERRINTGITYMSPAYDRKTSLNYVYRPMGPELKGPGGDAPGAASGAQHDFLQVVFSEMVAGKEDEFNTFYSQHHAPEVVSIPSFVRAQRMVLARPTTAAVAPTKYMALYWASTSDPEAVKRAADAAQVKFTTSPAFDREHTRGYTFRAIGPLVEGDKVRVERAKAKSGK